MDPFDTLVMEESASSTPVAGRYRHLREIGRGGMSVVYQARDTQTDRTVALKLLLLPSALSPEQQRALIGRFAREAQAVSQLSHPNIVAITEVGTWQGTHFLAMEHLEGETLRARLDRGVLPSAQVQGIVVQIASALDAIHAAGIVHRDVKPANIMLLPGGVAKLLDFGIARHSDDATITSTGTIVGSPAYMAPEQVMGEKGTVASDVWALGVLLYEMLAGRPPFTGDTIPSVLYQVTHATPPPVPGLPSPLAKVLRRALAKDPARRYADAGALASALREARLQVGAARPSPVRAGRLRGRGRPVLTLSLVVLAGLGLGMMARFLRHGSPMPRASAKVISASIPAYAPAAPARLRVASPLHSRTKQRGKRPTLQALRHTQRLLAARRLHAKTAAKHRAALALHHDKARSAAHHRVGRQRGPALRRVRYGRRFVVRRQGHAAYDPAAAQRLEHFIWAGGH